MAELDVLVVDDDAGCAEAVSLMLKQDGLGAVRVSSAEAALGQLEKQAFDLVISDVRMDGMNGLQLLERVKAIAPELPVLLITAHEDTRTGVAAMRAGAADFLMKPLRRDEVLASVRKALGVTRAERDTPPPALPLGGLIGDSRPMLELRDTLAKAAASELRVLLLGEPGTGKELAARAVHEGSRRARGPFIRMNCAAVPEALFESELFGTVKGAYTGAVDRPGRVELAEGGTLFLDEVGELGAAVQAKLLRLLQEKELERLGDPHTRRADVRVVAATNRPLEQMKRDGKFRQDLLDRLNGVSVRLPPLREHPEDLEALARALGAGAFESGALAALKAYAWPGNVRELQNVLERLAVFSADPARFTADDVGRELGRNAASSAMPERRAVDCEALKDALQRSGGNRAKAARLLNISRRTLYNKLASCGLS